MAKGNQMEKGNRKEEEEPLKATVMEGSSQTPTNSATKGGQQKDQGQSTTTPQASDTTQPSTVPCNKEEDNCVTHCMAS